MRAHARTSRKRARARFAASARVYSSCARVRARILTKINVLINSYLIRKSLKFRKDPSFRWGDIWLFVTMYDLDLKFLSFSKTRKSAILSGKKRTLRIIFFNFFLMRTVRSLWSAICKKRFRNPTYIDLTRVNRVNTNWGKSPALYNGVHVLVLFNHMYTVHTYGKYITFKYCHFYLNL